MKINRLFTFDVSLITDLNDKIRRGSRSAYVNDAVAKELYNENPATIKDSSSGRILAELRTREDVSDFLKKAIELEMKTI